MRTLVSAASRLTKSSEIINLDFANRWIMKFENKNYIYWLCATIIVMFMLPFVEAQLASECSGMVLCMILFHDFIR